MQDADSNQQHQQQTPRTAADPTAPMADVQPGRAPSENQDDPRERKDLNPARRPQRLYLRRERAAMPKAMTLLQETAFQLLNDDDKAVIVDAIRGELNYIM